MEYFEYVNVIAKLLLCATIAYRTVQQVLTTCENAHEPAQNTRVPDLLHGSHNATDQAEL